MVRLLLGSVVGGIAQFVIGFLFWGTPLSALAFTTAPAAQNADVQAALARSLTGTGAGTYMIPDASTPDATVLLGRGPVAMVHFSPTGVAPMDTAALIGGLVLSIVTILLMALALSVVADRVRDFASRFRVIVAFSVAVALYLVIGLPTYNSFMPWGYWVYYFVSSVAGLIAGGFVLTRWFMPAQRTL